MTKQQEAAEKILNVLEGQKFATWYSEGGKLDDYIRGEIPNEVIPWKNQKKVILEDIMKMFNIS
jgi:hypothetical protein